MSLQEYEKLVSQTVAKPEDITQFFPKTIEGVKRFTDLCMQLAKQEFEDILAIEPEDRTFENTMLALDQSEEKLSRMYAVIYFLQMVSPDKAMRDACLAAKIELRKFFVDVYLEPKLYHAYQDYMKHQGQQEDLTEEQRYHIEEAIKGFKRSGLHLSEEKLAEVKVLKKELAKMTSEYSSNIAEDASEIKVTEAELDGIDEHMKKNLKRDGDLYVLGCDYPTVIEIRQNCSVSKTREKLHLTFNNRAYPKNQELLNAVVKKKTELAKMLGFESAAALNIDGTMAKTPDAADSFLKDLIKRGESKWTQEWKDLIRDLPEGVKLGEHDALNKWDYYYLLERYKKKHFDIDERVVAEYFPVEKAFKGILDIYQKFFGVEFKKVSTDWLWHDDVELIEVVDKKTRDLLGYVYLDLYPREGKYKHYCSMGMFSGQKRDGFKAPYVGAILANFPQATADRPALLKFDEVTTFFHEFGHAMHGVLGRTSLAGAAGTSVKLDFVEVPSQMFEEWMYDKDMLAQVSGHYKTGEPLPEKIIDKMIALKKFDAGYFTLRQAYLSLVSLNVYQDTQLNDCEKVARYLHEKYMPHVVFDDRTHFCSSFGHLMGYGARYYAYQWARVYSLDLFSEVKKHGLLNEQIGRKLWKTVLGRGGSVDPSQLLKDFLGREPNMDAFLQNYGLE